MRKIVSLTLFLPFIPHASEAIVNSDTVFVILSIHTELILVIRSPLDDVSRQIGNHTELYESYIHALRNVHDVVPISV